MTDERVNYDGCFIFFGDIRFDARLQNLIHTLSSRYARLALVQVCDAESEFQFETCTVFSVKVDSRRRGAKKFLASYLALLPKAFSIQAAFYCAEDVFSLPIASFLARVNRARLFYDSRELYFAIGALSNKKMKQAVWSLLEEFFIADATVFTTGDLDSAMLQSRYRIPLPQTIYNFPRRFTIERNNALRERLHLSSEHVILLYQGMMGEGRGIFKMLDALEVLPEPFVLVMLGDGVLLEKTRADIQRRHLSKRAFALGAIPYDTLLRYTASADIGLALIEPISKSYELALPNKLFEYVLCQTPPIVSNLPAMISVIERHQVGMAVPLETEQIANAILHVSNQIAFYRERCRIAREVLNWDAQSEKVLSIFSRHSERSAAQ
ncbi:MAG: glycosyltransferase [Chloroherpetonaceae bacterium]